MPNRSKPQKTKSNGDSRGKTAGTVSATRVESAGRVNRGETNGRGASSSRPRGDEFQGAGDFELAAGIAEMTRAVDAEIVADRLATLADVVAEAGASDFAQASQLLSASEDIEVIGAIVGIMSETDLELGLELARLSGELRVAGSILERMALPTLADFLQSRSELVHGLATEEVLRSTGTRALATAVATTGADLANLSADDVAQGIIRLAAAGTMAGAAEELFERGLAGESRGGNDLEKAAQARRSVRGKAPSSADEMVKSGIENGAAAFEDSLAE